MSKKKSSKQRLPRDENEASSTTTSMIVDEVNDYEYFKVLWNEKMVGTNKQRGDNNDEKQSSCVQDAVMHQPKKKRRKKLPKGKKKMQKLSNDDDNKSTSQLHHYNDDTIIATNVEGRKIGCRTSTKRKRASGNKSTTQHQKMMSTDIESKHDVPLYERISRHQLNTLLGWASSHCRGNENTNSDTTASSEKEREIDLSHLPTAPPPPSHIAFLQQHMSKRLKNNNDNTNNELDDVAGKKKKGNNCNTATITTKQNNHNMHVSAYVAVGMAVEEALTARLMPLAKAHVERCRRLERKAHDLAECLREESITKIQSSQKNFLQKKLAGAILDAWTLPPEDAVMQLARDGTVKGNDALSSLLLGRKSELEDSE